MGPWQGGHSPGPAEPGALADRTLQYEAGLTVCLSICKTSGTSKLAVVNGNGCNPWWSSLQVSEEAIMKTRCSACAAVFIHTNAMHKHILYLHRQAPNPGVALPHMLT